MAEERAVRAAGRLCRLDLEGGRVLFFRNARPSRTWPGRSADQAWEDLGMTARTVALDDFSVGALGDRFDKIHASGRVPLVLDLPGGGVTVADPAGSGFFTYLPAVRRRRRLVILFPVR
jgi:hypothetical protein